VGFKKRKWKPNPLVPREKPKLIPKVTDYLQKKRISGGPLLDKENQTYKPQKWKDELKTMQTLEKFEYVFDKAQQISQNEDMAEQYIR